MADILPENNYNPAHAEDLKWVEVDKETLPHIEGKFGDYPRYAELIYNIASNGSGGTSSYNDLKNKPKINGVELYGNKISSELKLLGNDSIQTTIDENADDEHVPSSLAVKTYISQEVIGLYKFKGSKDTYEELPAEGNQVGDVWNVVESYDKYPAGTNYAWTGTQWDALGGEIDLSNYQEKLTAGDGITITDNVISATLQGTVKTVNNISPINGNITLTADDVDTYNKESLDTSITSLNQAINLKQDKLTAGTNITISNNEISVTNLTKASVGLDNVDNTSDANKPVSTATQTALDAKQDVANLVTSFGTTPSDEKYPSEKLVNDALNQTNQRVTGIENDTQTLSSNKQDKLTAGTNITITGSTISAKDTTYTAGDNIAISDANAISVTGVYTSEQVDKKLATKADSSSLSEKQDKLTAGTNISIENNKVSVSGIIPEATKATQDGNGDVISTTYAKSSDDTLETTEKTIVGAINELNSNKQGTVTSSTQITITPTEAQTATSITDVLAKPARVIVIPKLINVGAIYIIESDTYSDINPIYPDPTNNVYEFNNMQNVKIFVDTVGDAVDLVIEYRS